MARAVEVLADGIDDAPLVRALAGDRVVLVLRRAADVDGRPDGMADLDQTAGAPQLREAAQRNHDPPFPRCLKGAHRERTASQRGGSARREKRRKAAPGPRDEMATTEAPFTIDDGTIDDGTIDDGTIDDGTIDDHGVDLRPVDLESLVPVRVDLRSRM